MPSDRSDHYAGGKEVRPIAPSRPLRPSLAIASLALPISACSLVGDCLPPPDSPERVAFRQRLGGLVHVSQCHGPPTPTAFYAQQEEAERRKAAFLARIRASPLAGDLARTIRDDEEMSRNINEAECVAYDWDKPDDPYNVAEFRSQLEGGRKRLGEAEAAFAQLTARCDPR